MKNFFRFSAFAMTFVLVFANSIFAQSADYHFSTRTSTEGFTLMRSEADGLRFAFGIPQMSISDFSDNGYSGKTIELNGIYLPANAGAPNLPSSSRFIAIPNGASAKLNILGFSKEVIHNVDLLPAAAIPLGNDDSPAKYEKDIAIYEKDGFYPANPFQISEKTVIRGVEAVMLGITPFQYNPVTKDLIVYYDIEAEVVFEGGSSQFGVERLRNPWWDAILSDNVLNSNVLPRVDYASRTIGNLKSKDPGCDYLIIIPTGAAFAQWADTIRVFRQHQGINTKVVNLTEVGGNTVAAIEAYVNNAYNTWNPAPAAILLLGDYSTNAADGIISHTLNDHPGGYNPYISDNPFADVTGDNLPDISFARITARNAAELQHMINKFLNYERTPPTSAAFYNHPVTAMGWQTERWFQLCSETVNGFWQYGLGKNPVRENAIYSGTPGGAWSSNANTTTVVNYFGPNGLNYIPANTAHLTDWGGNATRVNNDINAGAFMLQHRDHGFEGGWGEPDYSLTNLPGLTNQDLVFVMSINCLTGKFNYSSECFTERFHRHNFGALGLIAATEVSYSFVNDAYVWGAYDNMWPQFMPAFGSNPAPRGILPAFSNAAGKYFLQQSSWPYNPEHKNITYNLFHHHGDGFMTVYSEVPQNLTVSHMPVLLSGMETFEVTANEGAMIALTVNDEIIGAAVAGSGPTAVPILVQLPGVEIRVTVTLQNYYRYEQTIGCIPPSGPYIIYNAYTINDAAGNGNGMIDYGENISLDVAVKNVGSETAPSVQVTASSGSPYITFINNSFTVGNVEAGAIALTQNALQFSVANNVPNNETIVISLNVTSGTNEWISQFAVKAFAPSFSVGNMVIDDSQGNGNGRLDPGETVQISISATNNGQSAAQNAVGSVIANSPFINITSGNANFDVVNAGQTVTATYAVEVAGGAPAGTVAEFNFDLTAGAYAAAKNFIAKIGLIIEDFETGNFSQFGWTNGGNQPWQVSNVSPYSGVYSAKSGTISHSQSSQLILQYEVGVADSISFYYKVSSESDYDYLRFYIGTTKVGEWSGTVDWTKASYPVTAGLKTFKWEYMKDNSVSSGTDCAWVDDVVFPPAMTTTAWAGSDMNICVGNTAQLNATATNYNTLAWTSSGTGSFSNTTILNPVYTPSTADYEAGNVQLTLTATGTTTIMDIIVLNFNPQAQAYAGEAHSICPNETYLIADANASNYSTLLWSTDGDGAFDNNALLTPVYTPGAADLIDGGVTITLTVQPLSGCNVASSDQTLTIYASPTVEVGEDAAICAGLVFSTEAANAQTFASLLWTSNGDGSFTDASALATSYSPGTNDLALGNVTLYLTAGSEGNCQEIVDSLSLTLHAIPAASLSPDQSICFGSAATVELTLTGQAPWSVTMAHLTEPVVVEASPYQMVMNPESSVDIVVTNIADLHCASATDVHSMLNVVNIPLQPVSPMGADTVDFNDGFTSMFTLTGVEGASSYIITLSPETAGTVAETDLAATVNWNTEFRGDASLKVKAVNFCGEGNWSDEKKVFVKSTIGVNEQTGGSLNIRPNPVTNSCSITAEGIPAGNFKLIVTDMTGKVVYTETLLHDGNLLSKQLNLSQFDKGVYFVTIRDEKISYRQKLIKQ